MLRRIESQLRGEGIPVFLLRCESGRAFRQLQRLQKLYLGGHCGGGMRSVRKKMLVARVVSFSGGLNFSAGQKLALTEMGGGAFPA